MYITTDLATALLRNKEIPHEKVLYVTDNRQKLHFEQLFESLLFFNFPSKKYVHVGFGTINDSNGNPLKTRDGGNLNLVDLYQQAFDYIQKINNTLSVVGYIKYFFVRDFFISQKSSCKILSLIHI